jgi:RND superfamily putative drug exporter
MRPSLTERLARASAARPRRILALWGAALVLSIVVIATLLPSALTPSSSFTRDIESKRADDLLAERLPAEQATVETLVLRSDARTADDPAFQAAVADLTAQVGALGPEVVSGPPELVATSTDGHAVALRLAMAGDAEQADEHVADVVKLAEAANGQDGIETYVTGRASVGHDLGTQAEKDLQTGELFGMPIALLILLVVFGAAVAALVPTGLAIVSIIVALAMTAVIGQAFELSFFVVNMLTMMGLAVGIDYSLFVMSRFREERAAGRELHDAIGVAGSTASRAVLFSGLTVVLALGGMMIVPQTIFISLALGAILVVFAAVIAALTLLPAVLALLGDGIERLRVPIIGRRAASGTPRRSLSNVATRRPVLALVATAAILVAAAVPFLTIETGTSGLETLPRDLQSRQGYEVLKSEFSGTGNTAATVVIDGPVTNPGVAAAIERLAATAATLPSAEEPVLRVEADANLAVLTVPFTGDPNGAVVEGAVQDLRTAVDATLGSAGVDANVTGETAQNLDGRSMTGTYLPLVLALVLGASFLLLLVAFRSIVVPLLAIGLNLLSVGAAYGLLVAVAQHGVGADLLGFQTSDSVEYWLPLFLFTVLFGLSMDYHVFLLSRIRERYEETGDSTESIRHGLSTSARLITGAALIMVAVFGGFAAGDLVMFQQMGFGLAVAVLIDATLVRTLLLPSAMTLLGRWNWYLPRSLGWLPHVSIEGPRAPRSPVADPV